MPTQGTHGAVTLPTGEQIAQALMQEINYNNGTTALTKGSLITFSTSTWVGTVLEVEGTTATGELHVRVEEPVPSPILPLTLGEEIRVDGVKVAEVADLNGGTYYYQQSQIVGKSSTHVAEVTHFNELITTFKDGSPQFDAFGKLQTSKQYRLADYVHSYSDLSNLFTDEIIGGASISYNNNTRGVTLTCGTAAGDKVSRTTDEYHHYQPGLSHLLEFTASLGDTGKENVTRRLGYYDDKNGIYLEMVNTSFNFVLRSNSTGSVVNVTIPQTEWNTDRMDGTGSDFNPTGYQIDPTKTNIYWIDLQWLGAGTIRFGVIINGVRVTCHSMHNANKNPTTYMSTASLPFKYEQENTGTSASTSEMNVYCATIKTEGEYHPSKIAGSHENTINVPSTANECLLGIRSAQTFNGYDNRITIYPRELDIYNAGSTPVVISLIRGVTITGGTWTAKGGESSAEFNNTATSLSGGNIGLSRIVGAGETINIEFNTLKDDRIGIRRNADITQSIDVAIGAKLLTGVTAGDVYLSFNWDEVRD